MTREYEFLMGYLAGVNAPIEVRKELVALRKKINTDVLADRNNGPEEISDLSGRARHCLRNIGVENIEELSSLCEADPLSQPHLGRKTLNELKHLLESNGMYFKAQVRLQRSSSGWMTYPRGTTKERACRQN